MAPDWASRICEAAEAHPGAGLFTGTLLFHGEEMVNSTGLRIDPFGRARDRDFRLPLSRLAREDGPVAGVSGGAALLRASMLREVGLFDPGVFRLLRGRGPLAAGGARRLDGVRTCARPPRGTASPRRSAPVLRCSAISSAWATCAPLARHQPLLKAAALVPLTMAYRAAVKAPLELLRGRPALAWAELRAAAAGGAAALRALSDKITAAAVTPHPTSAAQSARSCTSRLPGSPPASSRTTWCW